MAQAPLEVYKNGQLIQTTTITIPDESVNRDNIRDSLLNARAAVKSGLDAARADRQAWTTMNQTQMNRASRDSLDREVQTSKVLLDIIRELLQEFTTGPEV